MAEQEDSGQPALYGREAVEWFRDRRQFADAILDFGLTALSQPFGPDRAVGTYVPPRQPPWQPRHFFLAVDGDVRSEADWERLIAAHRFLDQVAIERGGQSDPAEQASRYRQFERELATFHVVLTREPIQAVALSDSSPAWFGG